jgi:hypothetical protein
MKKTVLFMTFFSLLLRGVTTAQNPYESIGKKAKVLTLSNGKYQEIFTNDTIVPIGSVMYNRVTGDIVAFLTRDTMYAEYNLEPEVVSRWLSPDPLGAKYPQNSPYAYVNNNPIIYIDPDGQEGILIINKETQTVTVKATYAIELGKNGMSREGFTQLLGLNKTLNDAGYSVTDKESAYNGYKVVFDLQFTTANSESRAQSIAESEEKLVAAGQNTPTLMVGDKTIANSIVTTDDLTFTSNPSIQETAKKHGVTVDKIGGITDVSLQHINLPKSSENNSLYKIHEIFHTLYFDRDGAKDGIGSGTQMPNPAEINQLINGFIKNERTTEEKK